MNIGEIEKSICELCTEPDKVNVLIGMLEQKCFDKGVEAEKENLSPLRHALRCALAVMEEDSPYEAAVDLAKKALGEY
jgi:hypothetical protein